MGTLGATLAIFVALAAPPPARMATADAVPLTLALRFSDPESAAPFPLEGVRAEVERLFSALGVRIVPGGETDEPVQVVMLAADRSRGGLPGDAMGAVARDPGAVPVVWILLPNVRTTLGGTTRHWPGLSPVLIARAVGRVLAHELVHLIAPDLPHADSGLMKASLGRSQLLNETVVLDPALGPTVRHRLARGRLRRPRVA
jgi:hypothetical protein